MRPPIEKLSAKERPWVQPISSDTRNNCWKSKRSCCLPSLALKLACRQQEAGKAISLTKRVPMPKRIRKLASARKILAFDEEASPQQAYEAMLT